MQRQSIAVAIALIAVGCTAVGHGKSDGTAMTTQPALAAGAPRDGRLPVYPDASRIAPSGASVVKGRVCNSEMVMTNYRVGGVAPDVIAKWYAARMPGAVQLTLDPAGTPIGNDVFAADGSTAVAAVQSGDEATSLGLIAFHPNLSLDVMHLMARYSGASQGEKESAATALRAKCPDLVKS